MRFVRSRSALLLPLLCLTAALWAGISPAAEPDKSLALGVVLHDAQGGPLLTLNLGSGCTFDQDGMACRVEFGSTRVDLPFLAADLSGQGEVRVTGRGVSVSGLTLSLPGARFDPWALTESGAESGAESEPESEPGQPRIVDIVITGSGAYDPAAGSLNLDKAEVRLADGSGRIAVLTGSLAMGADGLSARLHADLAAPERLLSLLGPLAPEELAQASFSGPVPLRLELDKAPGRALAGTLRLELEKPVTVALNPDTSYDLPTLTGQAELGPVDRPDAGDGSPHGRGWFLKGRVDLGGKAGSGLLADSRLTFDLDYLDGATVVRDISVHPSQSSQEASQLAVGRLGMSGCLFMPEAGGWSSPDLKLWLGPVPLSGTASMSADGLLEARLGSSGVDLANLAPVLTGLTGRDAAQWGMTGKAGLSLDVTTQEDSTKAGVSLRLRGAGFFDPEGLTGVMAGAQDLDMDLRLDYAAWPGTDKVTARLEVDKGGFLYSTMFFDFAQNPFTAKGSGRIKGDGGFQDLSLAAQWQGLFDLDASGGGSQEAWQAAVDLRDVQLGPVFQTFVAVPQGLESFKGEGAGLTGTAGLDLTLAHEGGVTDLAGRLQLEGGLATADQSLVVEDVRADLPLAYSFGGRPTKTSAHFLPPSAWGELSIGAVRTSLVEVQPGTLALALAGNRLYVDGGLDLPLYGGVVSLRNIECDNPLAGDFLLLTDVAVQGLDLANLGGSVPLQGVLHGDLGRVSFSEQLLVVPGTLKGSFFGGDLTLWGVFMEQPLSDGRMFGLDLVIRNMDLEPLSQATDFGRVTGLLDVELRGLTVAYGEPVTMWLMAMTPDDDDSSKTVSLKAVNSLSVLGTGSGIGDAGVGMFASFFEEFDYSRIGFLCDLDNDKFRLSGLIREGGVEYLIKKPFLTGINVVNRNPDSTVSFRDMMERVERVVGDESSDGPQIQMN